MYNNDDIQLMIDKVTKNEKTLESLKELLKDINFLDKIAILDVLSDGYYEAFDKYDSDVCETFICLYEKLCA